MKYINERRFGTKLHREFSVSFVFDDVLLTVKDTLDGRNIITRLDSEEREALISILQGETLSPPPPEFKPGQIVRTVERITMHTDKGALARVISPSGDRYVEVEWIDDRSMQVPTFQQRPGNYPLGNFEVVDPDDLTAEDQASIARRVVKGITNELS